MSVDFVIPKLTLVTKKGIKNAICKGCPRKKSPIKFFGFGLFVVFWTPLDTDLDTFGLFGRF